jgi:ribonucleoside-diphosphate reductase alpha chain
MAQARSVKPAAKNSLHDLGYKIFLDRYAQKDMTRKTLTVGDLVIVVVDSKTGQREIGTVTALSLPKVTVQLLDGEIVERDVENVDKPLETSPAQMMDRVAAGVAAVEKNAKLRKQWTERFRWLLDDFKFVPAGRILTAAGTDQQLTFYNCMPPEQEILTASGYKPIAEVRVGDLVVTHQHRLRPVLHKFERETVEPIYTIRVKKIGYDDVRVTGDHNVFAIRSEWTNKHMSRDGLRLKHEPDWIPAKELKPGDYLAVGYDTEECPPAPIHISSYVEGYEVRDGALSKPTVRGAHGYVSDWGTHYTIQDRLELDTDLCFLFGRWLGDGCITHRTKTDIPSGIKIVFGLDEKDAADRIAQIIETKFGIAASLKLSSTQRWYDLWVNSMPIGQFFKAMFGAYSYGKRIPDELMRLPRELTLALLHGLFSADGYISGNRMGIVLSNRVLSTQVHQLLLRLGYVFSIKENTHRLGRVPAYRVQATSNICGDLFERFFNVQPPAHDADLKYCLDYAGQRWIRIEEITISTYSGTVMDIEVAEDHSFVTAGVVVSNCYVIPSPRDSRYGIIETLRQMTEIMSRGGGVGINISSLRPRHAYVKGVNGRSSGAVSWGALYSFVTGLIEQGGCFGPNERIATDQGLIPAQELADRIDAGEVFYAQTHKGKRRITARFRNGIKPLYEMSTARGYKVRITEDHKVAVLMDGKITTMPLKYLRLGDEVLLLLGQQTEGSYAALKPLHYQRSLMSTTLNEDVRLPEVLNEDLAYLLGYMHGDGYVHMGRKVNWRAPKAIKMATADAYPEIRTRIVDAVQRTFGMQPTIEDGDGAYMTIAIYSRLVIEWLIANGLLKAKAEAIRVPEAIFRSPSSVQAAFIAGCFDADGCFRGKKGGYGIDSISREMLEDVQQLLIANGIVSRISATDRSELGWQTIYRLSVTGGTFKKRFAAFVPTAKASDMNGTRDMYITYPYTVWSSLGARAKYRQRIHDGVSERISFGQLERIGERLLADGQTQTADRIAETLNTVTDTIASITPVGESEVYDFEVDEVHLLSGSGVYTSNSRRGALMLILDDWHPDVFDFINSKRTAGQITNANISVGISDKLMDAIKADGDWTLRFPDTGHAAYDAEWDGDIDKWEKAGYPVMTYRTVKAREVWNAIIESAWASAEPGVFFKERYNKMSNSWYFAPIISTNPCVTGDTRVYTNKGLIPARELFEDETEFEVTIDGRFGLSEKTTPSSRVFMTGVKPVYRVQTREGYYLRATADHRVMTARGWVEVQNLMKHDRIHILNQKGGFGQGGSLELGRILGWVVGDGTLKRNEVVLSFFGEEKQQLAPLFADYVNDLVAPLTVGVRAYPVGVTQIAERDEARVTSQRLLSIAEAHGLVEKKHRVPETVFQGSEDMQRGFLQALFTADGSFQDGEEKGGSIRLAANDLELLEEVQQLLLNFGIASRIYRNRREAGYRTVPDANRQPKQYWCEAQHELVISKRNLNVFADEIGFLMPYKQNALVEYTTRGSRGTYSESFVAHVESVTEDGIEEVFDLTEPLTHSFVANTFVVHNCGEQGLPAFGVCNLGAINLAKFYDEERDDVNWDDLDTAVRYATRFLDNVIDTTPYFFEENKKQQLGERRVGLNNMGLAELLIRLRLRYGSPESLAFIDKLYAFIARAAYETSAELAAEKGAFPQFDAEKFLQSGFMQTMPDDIRETIRTKGIRNVTLLTQAPNGTTGTMVNTSTGIEPFFSWVYYRKSRLGLHEEKVPLAQEWLDAHPGETQLPDYFVTAMELAPEDHARVQGAIQRWCDSSISKTSNLPNSYTVDQTGKFYELLYELGCKGGTVYRDGSRDEQVLMLKGDERAESEMQKMDAAKTGSENGAVEQVATPHRVYPRPKKLTGVTVNVQTPYGTAYITMNSDENGYPFEVFITAPGKAGSDLQADAEGLGRMISLQLRSTAPQNRMQMLKLIIDQLQGIGGARSIGMGPNRVSSLPDAVAGALMDHYFPDDKMEQLALFNVAFPELNIVNESAPALPTQTNGSSSEHLMGYKAGADVCPACGTVSLIRAEGCRKCTSCGYSEC